MPNTPGPQKKITAWETMVDSNKALLVRKTGHDTEYWVAKAQAAGIHDDAGLRSWMGDNFGITGYAQYAVSWEMFGYPDFMLHGAHELLDAQYAQHPHLRAITDAILAWASATDGVGIQMRKGYVSLHSPRRKFAQVTRATNSAVDVTLRLGQATPGNSAINEGPPLAGRLEKVKTKPGDPFQFRVRITDKNQVDEELLQLLAAALDQNR